MHLTYNNSVKTKTWITHVYIIPVQINVMEFTFKIEMIAKKLWDLRRKVNF